MQNGPDVPTKPRLGRFSGPPLPCRRFRKRARAGGLQRSSPGSDRGPCTRAASQSRFRATYVVQRLFKTTALSARSQALAAQTVLGQHLAAASGGADHGRIEAGNPVPAGFALRSRRAPARLAGRIRSIHGNVQPPSIHSIVPGSAKPLLRQNVSSVWTFHAEPGLRTPRWETSET